MTHRMRERAEPSSYFEICYAAGWGGRFYDIEEARWEASFEGRSVRVVKPTDPTVAGMLSLTNA